MPLRHAQKKIFIYLYFDFIKVIGENVVSYFELLNKRGKPK